MDISKLSNSELQSLISRYMAGWQVSWSNYNREKVVEVLMTNGYIYSIIKKVARSASKINLMVGQVIDDTFEEDKTNNLYQVISKPNALLSRKEFIEAATIQYLSFGECFITYDEYEAGNNRGQIIEGTLQLIPPQIVDIKHSNLIPYAYIINGDYTRTIPAERVIHIKNYNPDYKDLHGLSPIQVALTLIDKLDAANNVETLTYQKGGPAYLVAPKNVDSAPDASEYKGFMGMLRKIWSKERQGVAGVNYPIDVQTLGQSPAAMGTIESQRNTMKILLTVWGLDAGLFDTDASTYNNKRMMEQAIYSEVAVPFVDSLAEKINDRFEEKYNAQVVIDTSNIEALQPNFKEKAEWMTLLGVFSENELREAVGYSLVEDENADLTPSQLFNQSLAGFNDLDREVVSRNEA